MTKQIQLQVMSQHSYTAELHLSGSIGTAGPPDIQKIWMIGFFFENGLHWQFEAEKNVLLTAILGCIFIYVQTKHYLGDDRQLSPLIISL